MASNAVVSSHSKEFVLAAILVVFAATSWGSATPVDSETNIPSPAARFVPAQLSGHAPRTILANPDRTFEKYGPQATERAVRSSLKVALVPDPLAMGALIFCAFALRAMRMRKEQSPQKDYVTASRADVLERAA